MATQEDVQTLAAAFKKAKAEGNTQQAEKFARALVAANQELEQPQEQQGPMSMDQAVLAGMPGVSEQQAREADIPGVVEFARGAGEIGLTALTGTAATVGGGLAGAITGISRAVTGDDDALAAAVEKVENITRERTFQPRSEFGQQALGAAGEQLQKFEEFADTQGQKTLEKTGSPLAATLTRTAVQGAPELFGLKGAGKIRQRFKDVKTEEARAQRLGVDPRRGTKIQREQVAEAAPTLTRADEGAGFSMEPLAEAVGQARKAAKKEVDDLYRKAREADASVPGSGIKEELLPMIDESLDNFDPTRFQSFRRHRKFLEEVADKSTSGEVSLNRLDDALQRINNDIGPLSKNPVDNAKELTVLGVMKGQIDNHLQGKFNADMINGDPTALQKWNDARAAASQVKKTFDENKTLRQMAQQKVEPQEMRNWIIGASGVGFKKQATQTIRTLGDIVGKKSPEFQGLQADILLNVMEPLLKENPSFTSFVNKYDTFIRRNPDVVNELFSDNTLKDLRGFRQMAASVNRRTTPEGIGRFSLARLGSVFTFGHEIAQQAAKVALGERIFNGLRGVASNNQRRALLSDMLGYKMTDPLLSKVPPAIGGVIETGARQEDAENPPSR